jgi:ABC-type multidrug transport system ATPase subunit
MNIITADQRPDAGKLLVCGERLKLNNLKKFYENVAFCPQHNPLWDELTLYEHLELYASIKGISKIKIKEECDEYVLYFSIFY